MFSQPSNSSNSKEGLICLDERTSNSSPRLVEAAAYLLNSKRVQVDIIVCTYETRIEIIRFPSETLRILPWGAHRSHVDLATALFSKFCVPNQDVIEGCCKACESFRQSKTKVFSLEVDSEDNSFTALITRAQLLTACAATVKSIVEEVHARKDSVVALWESAYIPGLREELSTKGCHMALLDAKEILDGLHMLVIENKHNDSDNQDQQEN